MRTVRVESVEFPAWLTIALATGVDAHSGEPVTFGMERNLALAVRTAIEDGATPDVKIHPLAVVLQTAFDA
jgi:hypothetical protein